MVILPPDATRKTNHHKLIITHTLTTQHNTTRQFPLRTNGLTMGCAISTPEMVAGAPEDNPKVFFDISVGGKPKGRIIMELRADVVPKTAEVRYVCGRF
jgi:hypothetical protein